MDIDFQNYRIKALGCDYILKSIKTRLSVSYFAAIFLTVVVLETICFISIKNYYYRTIEETLKTQAQISMKFYGKYSTSSNTKQSAVDIVQSLYYSTNAHIQIISKENKIIVDSLGIPEGTKVEYPDVKNANEGKSYTWIGIPKYTNEKCICVSYPIEQYRNDGRSVIRLESSLKDVDSFLQRLLIIFVVVGFFVVFIILIISIFISNSIINPLNNIIVTAKEMAGGKFSVRAVKKYNDEVGTLADTLNYMVEEILKNEKLKNDFISSVSHELRTPLTSIKGWALTLKLKEFTDPVKREEGLDIIVEESERLTKMVEELLDFSRFQSNRITLNVEDVDLNELIKGILNQIKPRADRNKINLESYIEDTIKIKADKNRLKQVFINILDNSLKFTKEEGNIILRAFSEGERIVISIEDCGCGIESEHLPNVLKKFYKVDVKKTGSGIGLAICDEIVKLHGGKLTIESTVGVGTKVTIFL